MKNKVGRNEPCPCGCGRKFKVCLNAARDVRYAREQAERLAVREEMERCETLDRLHAIVAVVGGFGLR